MGISVCFNRTVGRGTIKFWRYFRMKEHVMVNRCTNEKDAAEV